VAQSPGPTEPKDGRPAGYGLASFQDPSSTHVNLSQQEGYPMWERQCCHKSWPPGLTSGPPEPQFRPRHELNTPINTLLPLLVEGAKNVRFSFL
jgi:hypothetical protein